MRSHTLVVAGIGIACMSGCGVGGGSSGSPSTAPGSTAIVDPGTPPGDQPQDIGGDLFLTSSHYHGAFYFQDPEFDFTINNASPATVSVPYTIRADGVDIPGFPKSATVPANGKREIFHNPYTDIDPKPLGEHTYTVVVDPNDRLGETNEGNNLYRFVIDVPAFVFRPVDASSKIDLQFVDPHVHGPDRGRLAFDFIIKNVHPSLESAAFSWSVSRRGSPIVLLDPNTGSPLSTRISGLAAGSEAHVIGVYQESETVGDIPFSISIDSANEVDEQWEDNNTIDRIVVMNPAASE